MSEKVRDFEHLEEIFENTEVDKDLKFSVYEGLTILRKYDSDTDVEGAEHDEIWVGPKDCNGFIEAGLTVEDAERLRKMNWMIDEDSVSGHFGLFV